MWLIVVPLAAAYLVIARTAGRWRVVGALSIVGHVAATWGMAIYLVVGGLAQSSAPTYEQGYPPVRQAPDAAPRPSGTP